jgi:hypothetical protein
MKITRIPGDGDSYEVPAKLVNWLVYSILAALLTIGGYMVVWNRSDNAWKAVLMNRVDTMNESITELKLKVNSGVLPIAQQRLDSLDYRLQMIERDHSRQFAPAPQKAAP